MFNIALEVLRAVVLLGLIFCLWQAGRKRFRLARKDWRLVIGGLGLLSFGSLLDITDDFPALGRFVFIGDTRLETFLEVFVGFLGGTLVLAMGLVRRLPGGQRAADDGAPLRLGEEAAQEARLQGPMAGPQAVEADLAADITGRVSAEQIIGKSEEDFRAVVDNAPTAIFLKDMEGRYRFVNKRFEEWYGVSAAEARGRTSFHIFPQDSAEVSAAQDREALESGTAVSREQTVPFSAPSAPT
jgi:PAS domain-containing protein